ncbi:hypothetical protein BVC80_9037g40 [Macleaya cordata]|uniref:Uncharacterized protein n=1 Tax=Macleaya cordata TaxID=56857 RepID=A0A200Q5P8_MACCD|nr:hypothetical protein BVC80_9037g40 [Macleaya cordata]
MKFTQVTRLEWIISEAMTPLARTYFKGGHTRWCQMLRFLEIPIKLERQGMYRASGGLSKQQANIMNGRGSGVLVGQQFTQPAYSKVSLLPQPTKQDSDEELEYADSSSGILESTSMTSTLDMPNGELIAKSSDTTEVGMPRMFAFVNLWVLGLVPLSTHPSVIFPFHIEMMLLFCQQKPKIGVGRCFNQNPLRMGVAFEFLGSASVKQRQDGSAALYTLANKTSSVSPMDAAPPSPTP